MSVVRIFEEKKSLASMGEGPQWAVHVDRHEGRKLDFRCTLHRGLLCGPNGHPKPILQGMLVAQIGPLFVGSAVAGRYRGTVAILVVGQSQFRQLLE